MNNNIPSKISTGDQHRHHWHQSFQTDQTWHSSLLQNCRLRQGPLVLGLRTGCKGMPGCGDLVIKENWVKAENLRLSIGVQLNDTKEKQIHTWILKKEIK